MEERALKARNSNDATGGEGEFSDPKILVENNSEATSMAGGAGYGNVIKSRWGCLIEGEEDIGLLPGLSEQKEVQSVVKD